MQVRTPEAKVEIKDSMEKAVTELRRELDHLMTDGYPTARISEAMEEVGMGMGY